MAENTVVKTRKELAREKADATSRMADVLVRAREQSGLRLDDAASRARDTLGNGSGPSRETIRRLETGATTEDRADPLIVGALAQVYGVPVETLSPRLAEQLRKLRLFAVLSAPEGELEDLMKEIEARRCAE